MRQVMAAAVFLVVLGAPARAQVWGCFDESRVNYPGAVLSGGLEHTALAGIIAASGATLAPPSPALSPGYLAGVDVFYTSLLRDNNMPLSPAEQGALQAWLAGGGTLIVTADIFNLPGYTSFTAFLGVTGYAIGSSLSPATVAGVHPITTGVGPVAFTTSAFFVHPAGAQVLLKDAGLNTLGVVMDPTSGHSGPGRLAVFGDHNLFTNSFISLTNNTRLAQNLVAWANRGCVPDLTGSAVVGSPGYGTPNGIINNDDFFYFLAQFAAGNLAVCDLTGSAIPGAPGYGVPNGILNNDDFFFFLAAFAAGC